MGVTPRVPSPRGEVYVHATAPPVDPLVAHALAGRAWDEVLSGAAVGVALEALSGAKVDAPLARWRAVVAGYPYPIVAVASEQVEADSLPTRLMEAIPGLEGDLGLVRVRGLKGDLWVLLLGRRRAELPPIPREIAVGEAVELGVEPGGERGGLSWVVSDPDGGSRSLSGPFVPDRAGEWLLQASSDGETVSSILIYVDQGTPEGQPLPITDDPRVALAELRAWYGLDPLPEEPLLDGLARARLRAEEAGETVPAVRDQLRAAGFDGVGAAGSCRAATVQECLYALWWDPEDRAVLVGASQGVGLAWRVDAGRVRVVVVSAG